MRRIALLILAALLTATAAPAAEVTFVHRAPGAQEVYLAGSFNGWNAFDIPMADTGGGVWSVVMDLAPGEYQYKFVVDSAWTQDEANAASAPDGYGGENSVVAVPDGVAELVAGGGDKPAQAAPAKPAKPAATAAPAGGGTAFAYDAGGKVGSCCLAGEFNDWNPTADAMSDPDGDGVYTISLDLAAGSYQYKFVVDGNWFADPAAAETADDGFGGQNSVVTVGAGGGGAVAAPAAASGEVQVAFAYDAGGAVGSCYLAGEMNGWNPTGTLMSDDDGDGVYTCVVPLPPGRTLYKFVVDGNWLQDPTNPNGMEDGFGFRSTVLEEPAGVATFTAGGAAPCAPTATPAPAATAAGGDDVEVTFNFTPVISGVASVNLAGSFNGWSTDAAPMSDPEEDGTYSIVVPLAPGQYAYKFVVDGEWLPDPNNSNGEDDGFGGQNSVVIVKHGAEPFAAVDSKAPAAAVTGVRTVKFAYAAGTSAANVFLAGTFNDWNDSKQRMTDADGDGVFETTLLLQPGSYQYKFVVDGSWHHDPENPDTAEDGFGGSNSLLEVDDSFEAVRIERGDGRIFTDDLEPIFDYSTCNPLSMTEIEITARAHLDDVESVSLRYSVGGGGYRSVEMTPAEADPAFQYYRARVDLSGPDDALDYLVAYRDGDATAWLGREGVGETESVAPFHYDRHVLPPFATPDWARDGVIYQIFPERFRNGNPSNDPDFSEPWYEGVNELPASGKTNGEYFHMVEDWSDVAGLSRSPYRTDGRPDYYSFYGGDIAGVREKLGYLNDLGITVIYFNPLNQGMSNHKYDPTDYNTVDPHFADPEGFKAFVADAHDHGIRIVVDMAFNHTGNWHFAFRDDVVNGPESKYWNWYEWKKWPLPDSRDFNASDYYDCWWGFGLHPNLNYDLERPNNAENNIADISQADPNMAVVEHVLGVARYWLGELDIDGFRLDVPNEVPFWFWKMFNEVCHEVKPDCWLVGEIWGNAGSWIGPHCFDSTMNYKYFRDPVMEFMGQGRIDAATFDQRLAPGRFVYPPQSVQVMMNLIDSHDTIRFLTTAKDVRRLMMAAMFSMSYVGMPHIWYGDEVGMTGGKDPDCRRPMDWKYADDPEQAALRDYYGTITRFRRDHEVLSRGDFRTLLAAGRTYAFARTLDTKSAVALFNADTQPVTFILDAEALAAAVPEGAGTVFKVIAGPDWFPNAESGSLTSGRTLDLGHGALEVTLPPLSGALLAN
ncbi:hypothetical protein H8E07_15270 [bacterium]|nr:hypothetical protein [bacterium]